MKDTPTERQDESAWTRMRRRKVVQWGLVYVAAAWGFLQGLAYLSSTYDWPRQIQQLTTLALLIGLPIVVVLAWYHGDRGQQRITTSESAIVTLLLLLGGGAFWYYQHASETATVDSASPTVAPLAADRSIAVLPFVNMSNDPEQEYFSDGISEELMLALARIKVLKVAARTSAFSFKGKDVDLRAVGRALNVRTVLEGSVRKSGDQLRITAQLSDVATGYQLWSETYERKMTDIFVIQDDITSRIVSALQIQLEGGAVSSTRAQPVDPEVYQLLLRGRFHWNQRTPEGFAKAAVLLQDATRRAPQYAPAFAALADVYLSQYDYGLLSWEESTVRARAAATKALELDDRSAAANTSLAHILLHEWQWPAAESRFQRAIELDPGYTLALHWYALCLTALGRADEAVETMQRALHLDPLSARINADLGMAMLAAGRYEEAVTQEGRTLELKPDSAVSRWIRGMALEQLGQFDAAEVEMKAAAAAWPGNETSSALGHLYAVSGKPTEARAMLKSLTTQSDTTGVAFFAALVCAGLNDRDAALTWLEQAVDERSGSVRYLKIDPRLANLRKEPRYGRLMARVGLPP